MVRQTTVRVMILLALGVGDDLFPRSWRLLFFGVAIIYVALWVSLTERRRAVDLVRRFRHRYANHIQVVSGWLQLGETARAEQYLDQVITATAQDALAGKGLSIRWTYWFLRLEGEAEAHAVTIAWSGRERFLPSWGLAWMLRRALREAIAIAAGTVVVELGAKGFQVAVLTPVRAPAAGKWGLRWHRYGDGWLCRWGKKVTPGGPVPPSVPRSS